ncbi:RlpA-like double-psi beta-barrel-protein domain-containing protein-containing protein [Russula dissimulans]|nr:RlpA-like double-psi beta-barrel-protein domain-containing protein-containing protein [Russula dissimulans]
MVRIVCIGSLVLAAVTAVSGHVIRRRHPPMGWQTDILEPYVVYNERYLNWGCEKQHNTVFFNQCCHPLLKDECIDVLEDRGCPSPPGAPAPHPPPATGSPEQPKTTPTPVEPGHDNPPHVESTSTQPAYTNTTPATTHTEPPSAPTTTTSSSPAQATPTGLNMGGQATYFYQDGNAGACGAVHQDTDFIAAMDQARYGNSGGKSPLCGRQVLIYNALDTNKKVTVTVADDCPTCLNMNSIDLSVAAFEQLAPLSVGVVPIEWMFLS